MGGRGGQVGNAELNPSIAFAPLDGLPHKSAHLPRSRLPISMLTADCGAEVLPASTAIGALVRVKERQYVVRRKPRARGEHLTISVLL